MRGLLTVLLVVCMASFAFASDFGVQRNLDKPHDASLGDGALDGREGGETIADAFVIAELPFADTGSTSDNINDYDEVCPYSGSIQPDVVYSFTPGMDMVIDIDLCGSLYDTKLYVYENAYTPGVPYACDDDFYGFGDPCGSYASALMDMPVTGGNTYYIVIDGYGTSSGGNGTYNLEIAEDVPCIVDCPPGAADEGEPDMGVDPDDVTNGGCNTDTIDPPFTLLEGSGAGCITMCCNSGWPEESSRDTDWFQTTAAGSEVSFSIYSEIPLNMFQLSIPDCDNAAVVLSTSSSPCEWATLSIPTTPGEIVYLWAGPTVFDPPSGPAPVTVNYITEVCGIVDGIVATDNSTWGNLKSLYK